ncbi:DUF418 domain-containing protein [Neobacillus dielmonensis]|uniref:DUF418 domain-containing protein n=1 Tax=Neobacillus dielmonensis TaxID=1347369 RepID=UPI0005A83325|nr:DUF418 domain-containing protein [Neobacillus dielmonensis]
MEENKRIDVLDYLRGFALMGIVLVNVISLLSLEPLVDDTADTVYWRFLYLFVEGRFYTIFTFLFGTGFYLFLSRAFAKGKNGYILFLRRILVLFIFGLIHVQFHPGEALTIYAVCGLLLLPFYKVTKEINLFVGFCLLIILSYFSIKILMVIPLMLLGIAAGQYHIFEKISDKKLVGFIGVMFALGGAGIMYQNHYAPREVEHTYVAFQRFLEAGIMIGPVVSAFYASVLIWLVRRRFFQKLFAPLKSYGRLALTNYVSQTAYILIAGSVFHLSGNIGYLQSLALCIVIYIIQLSFSVLWLRYFRFGPLEWVWRMITYLEILPIRKVKIRRGQP